MVRGLRGLPPLPGPGLSTTAPGGDVPPELLPLSWLIGTWVGAGVLAHPTLGADQRFGQEVVFSTDGRALLAYLSRTWLLDDGGRTVEPLSSESGYWRPLPDNEVEVLLAHDTGHVEVWLGKIVVTGIENAAITGARIEMHTDVVARTVGAEAVTAGSRLYGLVEGDLLWAYDRATEASPMSSYASARLKRAHSADDPVLVEAAD